MTLVQERQQTPAPSMEQMQTWKHAVEDHTMVVPLEMELPHLTQELGSKAARVAVLTAADNLAGSYKWRGAFNATSQALEQGASSIVAASAGNFGSGVVLAAKHFELHSSLYLPSSTSPEAIKALKDASNGHITVDTTASDVDEAVELAVSHSGRHAGSRFLHPFDNPATIRGQGTMADDILRLAPDTSQIVIATGGNGAGSGIAERLIELGRDDIRLVMVQAHGSNSLERSLYWEEVTDADNPNRLYRGAKVKQVGQACFERTLNYDNRQIVTVSDEDVKDLATLYVEQNEVLLRDDMPMYEPTTLLAFTALRSIDLNGNTVVVGTGTNQSPRDLLAKPVPSFLRPSPRLPYGRGSQK